MKESRRTALRLLLGAALGMPASRLAAQQGTLPLTPECGDADEPTPSQTAGPFFKPSSPERSSLRVSGDPGMPVRLRGRVLTRDCRPVPGAILDFWHADDAGRYDLEGFRYRGHLFAGGDGTFQLETIRPGLYPGRTRHFHVRVQAPNGPVLTTQLYFPGEPANERDFLFRPELLMRTADEGGSLEAAFDFVIET